MMARRLKSRKNVGTTVDAVYEVLRRSILDGALPPGHRLRSDVLANDLNVSRTPVREALRKLETEGLVDASRSGLVVGQSTEEDLIEIFYMREALEGMAARLAAENATRAEVDELKALFEDMETLAAHGDISELREVNPGTPGFARPCAAGAIEHPVHAGTASRRTQGASQPAARHREA